ncbi:MAG: hypothetical protein L3J26_10820 [Candidatus Polarisedimenticolaceae bacterium]|nr:hypothetical protein [Candidatus Polarisedimenticolaceae bacterium]
MAELFVYALLISVNPGCRTQVNPFIKTFFFLIGRMNRIALSGSLVIFVNPVNPVNPAGFLPGMSHAD